MTILMAPPCTLLVVGYGNELRGDDAVGPRVARAVDELQLSSVNVLAVPQLLPELAADLARADGVVFVDACCDSQTLQLDLVDVTRQALQETCGTHSCTPVALLSLAQILYGRYPQAWLLQIPAARFDVGAPLSTRAGNGCDRALETLKEFIETYQQSCTKSA